MRRNHRASAIAIAASAGALFAAGCASPATTVPAAAGSPAAKITTPNGTVRFIGYSKDSDGPDFTVILTGAIGDYGPAVTVHPNGTIDPEHTSQLRLELKKGSFRLNIASLDKAVGNITSHYSSTPTCSFHASATAATPVVPGSGTGSYTGISGSLTLTVTIDEVDVKPCPNGTSSFLSQLIFIVGSGNVLIG